MLEIIFIDQAVFLSQAKSVHTFIFDKNKHSVKFNHGYLTNDLKEVEQRDFNPLLLNPRKK